ncbi:MAG: hypothetical protein IKT82_05175 [Bacteroidaceae bacterium]|jgi:signal peptidase I|nr:hypothetical protein [Bacteroidaceae bacterium]
MKLHKFRLYILPLLLALLVLVVVRYFFLTQYVAEGSIVEWGVHSGDRILVNRLAYAGGARPEAGDRIAFRHQQHPDAPVCLATCTALPGDTVWMDTKAQRVASRRRSHIDQPLVVPAAGQEIDITPHNARQLWHLLSKEGALATLRDNQEILIDGRVVKSVAFLNDYYWMETQHVPYGLVPFRAIVGKPFCVSYGMKDGSIRFDRLFLLLN